ncbi:MAG: adenosine deaminase [Sphingobacteriia bacterium]|nr:adenosine deaminase [Sphingobacteriia bacterium]
MKICYSFLLWIVVFVGHAQPVSQYFEKIRNNDAALTAFFSRMPKGGDLHHHYGGSVYAETLLAHAIEADFFVNAATMTVAAEQPVTGSWERLSAVKSRGALDLYKDLLIRKWSVKDYNDAHYPSDKQFFESFDKFGAAIGGSFEAGLTELKQRAIRENLSYIETQLTTIPSTVSVEDFVQLNERLRNYQATRNEEAVFKTLDTLYTYLVQKNIAADARKYNVELIEKLHHTLRLDDSLFTMRYQNFVLRFMEPVTLFRDLVAAFISADLSPIIDGVNIVSPEHGETSMKDYWLHMVMYKYCNTRYPKVRNSLHAGELALGLVLPEALTWHIGAAVHTARASRIGHGVDIAHEANNYELLRYMAKNKVTVEINLVSNEFILKIKEGRHPILLYKAFSVPMVISTDDAGVLRTNMTEQYVLLAKRYKDFSYAAIKQLVYNSLEYSFIEDPVVKRRLIKDLDARFRVFESGFTVM